VLLPIDGTEEALRPVEFLARLYPTPGEVSVVLGYCAQPIPPVYQGKPASSESTKKREEFLQSREQEIRSVMDRARKALIRAGFSGPAIEEYVMSRTDGKAKAACLLADQKRVDAVLVQKRVTSSLEGFLRDDPTPSMLNHCLGSPVWVIDGTVDISHAVVCITNESASLRAADHTAFMLSGTGSRVTLLHASRSISYPVSSPVSHISEDLQKWMMTPEGTKMKPFFMESHGILNSEGIGDDKIRIAVLPSHGKVAMEVLSYCREKGIGIIVVGHSRPSGIKDFLKGSVTKKVLSELKNMTLWVNQ